MWQCQSGDSRAFPRAGAICSIFTLALLSACGPMIRLIDPKVVEREKIDSLITFKERVASGNYLGAVHRLVASEQAQILEHGHVREDMKPRLSALRLKDLAHNPKVGLERGKLKGIYNLLPVVKQGQAITVDSSFDIEEEATAPSDSEKDSTLHAAARMLFADIHSKSWQYALNDMSPGSRSVFIGKNGKLKSGARERLLAIDTTGWKALTLRDGKLSGIVLLIPPPATDLERASDAFFDAISKRDWNTALSLLVVSERDALSGPDGKIKSSMETKLAKLDPEDWDALFLFNGLLSGVIEMLPE